MALRAEPQAIKVCGFLFDGKLAVAGLARAVRSGITLATGSLGGAENGCSLYRDARGTTALGTGAGGMVAFLSATSGIQIRAVWDESNLAESDDGLVPAG